VLRVIWGVHLTTKDNESVTNRCLYILSATNTAAISSRVWSDHANHHQQQQQQQEQQEQQQQQLQTLATHKTKHSVSNTQPAQPSPTSTP